MVSIYRQKKCEIHDNMSDKQTLQGENGEYTLDKTKILGKGSFSYVYQGYCTNTNTNVAVKRFTRTGMDIYDLSVISRELKIIKYLMNREQHSNIVKYYDIIDHNQFVFVVMELCNDGAFSSMLLRPFKECYVKHYVTQLISAVSFLYHHNIVHQDIKPSNILMTDNKRVIKLCDFGFAELIGSEPDSLSEMVFGSITYMAPEMLNANIPKSCDIKIRSLADSWSIGAIMYQMIKGVKYINAPTDLVNIKKKQRKIRKEKHTTDTDIIVNRLLCVNIRKRLGVDDLTRHIWYNNKHVMESIQPREIFVYKSDDYNDNISDAQYSTPSNYPTNLYPSDTMSILKLTECKDMIFDTTTFDRFVEQQNRIVNNRNG